MGNPTLYDLSEANARALGDTIDSRTGIKHLALDVDEDSDPDLMSRLKNFERKLFDLLDGTIGGKVVWTGTGRNVEAFAMEYELAGTAYSFAGNGGSPVTLPVSDTSYVYLDSDETLKSQITEWPSGDIVKLAKVTTNATEVTALTDMRLGPNFLVGLINAWWTNLPTAAVDLNEQDLDKVANLGLADPVTIAPDVSGNLDLTGQPTFVQIDTYNQSATDDVDSFTVDAQSYGRLFVLQQADPTRWVTIKGNATGFKSFDGDFDFNDPDKMLVLLEVDGSFVEVARNFYTMSGTLTQHVNATGYNITNVGAFSLKAGAASLTINNGAITLGDGSHYKVLNEAAAAEDNLDTINGGTAQGQILLLWAGNAAQVPTLRHGVGNLGLANGRDYALTSTSKPIALVFDGTNWLELGRDWSIADLVDTAKAIPYPIGPLVVGGALSVAVLKINVFCKHEFILKDARGIVGTAPSGGACIVDIRDDGNSIYSDQAEMINIADGQTADSSAAVDHVFAAGSVLTIEIEAANGAADLTVSFDAYIAPQTPPT